MSKNEHHIKIPASESTAIRKSVECAEGHQSEIWYIKTPEGIVIETFELPHQMLPPDENHPDYINGSCCFKAACDTAWKLKLHI